MAKDRVATSSKPTTRSSESTRTRASQAKSDDKPTTKKIIKKAPEPKSNEKPLVKSKRGASISQESPAPKKTKTAVTSSTRRAPPVIGSDEDEEQHASEPESNQSEDNSAEEHDEDLEDLDVTSLKQTFASERAQWGSKPSKKAKNKANTSPSGSDTEQGYIVDSNDEAGFEDIDNEEIYEKKVVGARALARQAEVPRWSSSEDNSITAVTPKSEDSEATSITNSSKDWPEEAHYTPPQPGSRGISLNAQPRRVQTLIKAAIRHVTGDALFIDAYPPIASADQYYRRVLTDLATEMQYYPLRDRIGADNKLVEFISHLLGTRISNVRCLTKKNITAKIELSYHLSASADNCKEQVKKFLSSGDYIYPRTESGLIMRTKPFNHPIIVSSLRDYYFTGSRGSLAERFASRFSSSLETEPQNQEHEVPIPMVCTIATATYAALQDWNGGFLKKTDFNSDAYEDVYRGHELFLNNIRRDNPAGYHRLMANLFNEVNSSQSQSAQVIANNSLTLLDLAGMDV